MDAPLSTPRHWTETTPVKLAALCLVFCLLLVPMFFVFLLLRERSERHEEAAAEVMSAWASSVVVAGPVLAVPTRRELKPLTSLNAAEGPAPAPRAWAQGTAYFLPEALRIEAKLLPEVRRRGINEVVVFRSQLSFEGNFGDLDLAALGLTEGTELLWHEARLEVSLQELRGIESQAVLDWGGASHPFEPARTGQGLGRVGLAARLVLAGPPAPGRQQPFRFDLEARGSRELRFFPAAKETQVHVASSWRWPRFVGFSLPATRTLTQAGFEADWKVPYFGRSTPQQWHQDTLGPEEVLPLTFGVDLFIPADGVQQTERAAKYALLVILLTLTTCFILELLGPVRLHPMHYLLVGAALVVFYVLLLALAEHLGFAPAYLIAGLASIGLISAYARSIYDSLAAGGKLFLCLVALYGFIFVLLRAEDYALLLGSIALFLALALVMRVTRRLDWSSLTFRRT